MNVEDLTVDQRQDLAKLIADEIHIELNKCILMFDEKYNDILGSAITMSGIVNGSSNFLSDVISFAFKNKKEKYRMLECFIKNTKLNIEMIKDENENENEHIH
jgi:hypothetical protein